MGLYYFSSSSSNSSPTTNSSYFHFQYAVCLFLMLLISASSSSTERSTYIVHTDKSIMPKAFPTHHHWYSSIVNSLKFTNSKVVNHCRLAPSLVHVYDNALHGFSASLTPLELEELKKAPWFITSYMDRHATIDTVGESNNQTNL
ncbi:Peptidase S8, subtilisin-related [Trema orientale]|uniref:Peptidase S8, subtilisin-related n=1 Tax=Trema orientale TaxID=63057 RepID=A0A2P5FYX1_TREOI|nr:Peptidase S8, subtilisin-related [Trema orientale]